jgi:hypothetical protein
VYGRTPKNTPKVRWEVTNTVNDGSTVTKTLVGHVDNSSYRAVDRRHSTDADNACSGHGSGAGHHAIELRVWRARRA